MSRYTCQICHEYTWAARHVCPPTWECYEADDPEERTTIYARDAEQAAEKYAEQTDLENEYNIMEASTRDNEESEIVVVLADGKEERFLVSAEIVYQYSARLKKDFDHETHKTHEKG